MVTTCFLLTFVFVVIPVCAAMVWALSQCGATTAKATPRAPVEVITTLKTEEAALAECNKRITSGYSPLGKEHPKVNDYMESEEWDEKRRETLRRAGYCCRHCGITGVPLDVHHETYERYGDEKLSDLTALCRDCHNEKHE